jgi:hypothetical protein
MLEVRLTPGSARAVVRHVLTNQGESSLRLAPWAITQLAPGGVAILPQCGASTDESPFQPNRRVVLWPYTDLGSEAIQWRDKAILIHARLTQGKTKLGYPNPSGWLGYWRKGTLFIKRAAFDPGADYVDMGSSSQCYCDARFLELETLGPAVQLESGKTLEHTEVWSVHEALPWTDDLAGIFYAADGQDS